MELKICRHCQKPFLAEQGNCPRCGKEYEWDPNNWVNATCFLLMILFTFFCIMLPILMLMAMFFRW